MQGKVLPQVGVIEIAIIEEDLPRLLEFERGTLDIAVLRSDIAGRLLADNKLKPEYAARGIARHVYPEPYSFSVVFNMDDPVSGGMSKERVALRRAIALGFDRKTLIEVVYNGQALPANQLVPPGVAGFDPSMPPSPYDPAAANALLDRFGYRRGADGFRAAPDGKPLTITMSLRTAAVSRETATSSRRRPSPGESVGLERILNRSASQGANDDCPRYFRPHAEAHHPRTAPARVRRLRQARAAATVVRAAWVRHRRRDDRSARRRSLRGDDAATQLRAGEGRRRVSRDQAPPRGSPSPGSGRPSRCRSFPKRW